MSNSKDSFWHDGRYIHSGAQVWTVVPRLLTIVNHSIVCKHNHAWVACTHAPIVKPSHGGYPLVEIENFNKIPPDGAKSFLSLEEAEAAFPKLVGKMVQGFEGEIEKLEEEKRAYTSRIDARIDALKAKILAAKSVTGGAE